MPKVWKFDLRHAFPRIIGFVAEENEPLWKAATKVLAEEALHASINGMKRHTESVET